MKEPKSPRHWQTIEPILAQLPWAPQTLKLHKTCAKHLDRFDDPAKITQADLNGLRTDILARYTRNAATGNIVRIKRILRKVYGREDLKMPAKGYGPAELLPPSIDETGRIYQALRRQPAAYLALLLTYESGLRPMEVAALDVLDVQAGAKTVLIRNGKTGMRAKPISDRAVEACRDWLPLRRPAPGHEKALILNYMGKRPNKYGMLNKAVKVAAAEAGVNRRVTMNLMRSALATHMLSLDKNPKAVQAHMGHKKLETTMLYNRLSSQDVQRQVESFWDVVRDRTPAPPSDIRKEIGKALAEGRMSLQEAQTVLSAMLPHAKAEPEQPGGYS